MKYDLNSILYNKELTFNNLLETVSQEQIFQYYLNENIVDGGLYKSPFREDKTPSFSVYWNRKKRDVLMFKDFGINKSGDCVEMIREMYNLNYYEALSKIALDLGIVQNVNSTSIKYIPVKKKEAVVLGIKKRFWLLKDKIYWTSFGISKKTLEKYNVVPIEYVFFNGNPFKIKELAYCYQEFKDNCVTFKIYKPFASKTQKWLTNANRSVHQGYSQLPEKGDLLIITKSLKDVMSLYDCVNIPAVGLQSESITMKNSVMEEYKTRFKRVVCLFDNDEAGKRLALQFSDLYNIESIEIPVFKNVTDFSDLVREKGVGEGVKIIKNLIK